MAIGLNDIKKKSDSKKAKPKKEPRPMARPWSNNGLSKQGLSRKLHSADEAVMGEDWPGFHELSPFQIDLSPESLLGEIQEHLLNVEDRFHTALKKPKKIAALARSLARIALRQKSS